MYQHGRIYKIGSTTINGQTFCELKYDYGKKRKLYDRLGCDNSHIELIPRFPCNVIEELRAKEQQVRISYKTAQNSPSVQ